MPVRKKIMIPCVYSKQKKKKLKTWFDGFVVLENNKMKLYDEDKKIVDSKTMNKLSNEIETMRNVIYIEGVVEDDGLESNSLIEGDVFNKNCADNSKEKETISPTTTDNPPSSSEKQVGRTNEDILNLFKNTK